MYRICLLVYLVSIFTIRYWCYGDYLQERAKLTYANPKYVRDAVVFTRRKSRNDPYLTNMTFTILVPFADNVTCGVVLKFVSGGDFKFNAKVCESLKRKWMHEYLRNFTNITLEECPVQPGRYTYNNMELPPKNMPLAIADGDYSICYALFMTATKEPIIEVCTMLKFIKNKKPTKGKKG